MDADRRPVALITGGSRGIGAATALALAESGYDVVITYRNKAGRAREVAAQVEQRGGRCLALQCDITRQDDVVRLFASLRAWCDELTLLVLNASGGLERDLVAADPQYPFRINRDAQLAMLDAALPLLPRGATIVFVTSHWAYLYGRVEQIPAYEPVAESKHAGEVALCARQQELAARGLRLIIVTGDLIEGTITPKLLERSAPAYFAQQRGETARMPRAEDMGQAIARAATDATLQSGATVVVGRPLEALLSAPLNEAPESQ